jgi:hypothetical protein
MICAEAVDGVAILWKLREKPSESVSGTSQGELFDGMPGIDFKSRHR